MHHNLIPAVLRYHHIPDHIQLLIRSLYSNFQTSIITDSFQTPFIKVGRGVLQGDCLSPLTFNLCFNTFIHYISEQKFKQCGFSTSSLLPIHWFQFADDAVVITGLENENQILLNHFTRWYTWANMIIRVDKCSTFGIRKSSTASTQYLPKLLINQFPVPTVAVGKSFKYLGRYFNFSMDNIDHMSEVLQLITSLMRKIDEILVIRKTNCCYIIGLFFPRYHGILLLQILVRHGFLRISIISSLNISASGLSFRSVPPLVLLLYQNRNMV